MAARPATPAMRAAIIAIALLLAAACAQAQERDLVRVQRSTVRFTSEAPLETITATTTEAKGILDRSERSFAVQIPVVAFEGFNAPLQREHFQENYMVSRQWPMATFTGRVIEAVDLRAPGSQAVRAKGELTIRGTTKERIIPCTLDVVDNGVRVRSSFEVPVADHGIRIPRVVQQKVSAVVRVEVDLFFAP
ncbi:MAG: YceI family protein [Flavobacteriales bacterium]|nr:YceI family protein [Flavobacteriales bacterium]